MKTSSSSKPHFFKFLFPDPLANLRIPKEFYKHLPKVLPKRASLVTQSCKICKVDVCQNEEGICLSRGWSEFVKAHDLQLGYFLLFRYEGKMVFSVKVFDTTCCLKDYALAPSEPQQPIFKSSKVVDLTSDIKSETYPGDAQIPVDSGKKRKNASGKAQLVCEEDRDEGESIFTERREKKKKIYKSCSTVPWFEKTLPCSSTTKCRASLAIPKRFCVENGLVPKQAIFLMNSNGNKRRVKLLIRRYNADLTTGWRGFSEENELKEGDKCIFQLINRNTFLVNVLSNQKCWTGGRQQTACSRKNSYTLGSEKSTKRITGNTDPVSECERTIAHYHISSAYMNFPRMFCKRNGLTSNRIMKLKDSENHEWTMNFNYSFDGRLASGWPNFTKKNGLEVGDKLKFKVLAPDTMLFLRCKRVRDI
ncbi:hypothetical protein LUZ61_001259 [Rhynchospora tenuis]|uniref:TF-B3 domain-containing protein n=1 Tax=Rhynchospora tenuis TaxID=198213 RepID=A0AAD6EQM2_9POAL|nr:hypothetical protein LUZ61_001259 [Rhynchospora tenuis]